MAKHVLYDRLSRRMFLGGAVGAGLALPFLPSLATTARAQQQGGGSIDPYRRVLFIGWAHGVAPKLWKPTFSVPHQSAPDGSARYYEMSDATPSLYMGSHFDALRHKITMIEGVSQIGAWNHSPAVALSASERRDSRGDRSTYPISIDNVIADSSALYASPPEVGVLRLSLSGDVTQSFRDGVMVKALDAPAAFHSLFPNGVMPLNTSESGPSPVKIEDTRRKLIVDRVIERYRGLLRSGSLAEADRQIVNQTMEGYYALQTKLQQRLDASNAGPDFSQTCQDVALQNADDTEKIVEDHINLFVQGFACGATRVGFWQLKSSHAETDGAHSAYSSANKAGTGLYSRIMQKNCGWIGKLLTRMDAIVEGNGKTLLDNTLVVVTSDMATSITGTHDGIDAPFLLAGGLGGAFRMGKYLNYHDYSEAGDIKGRAKYYRAHAEYKGLVGHGGPPHNELMIALLNGLGVPKSEYETDGQRGFGSYVCEGHTLCTIDDNEDYSKQAAYVEYYKEIYAPEHAPGRELPFLRTST